MRTKVLCLCFLAATVLGQSPGTNYQTDDHVRSENVDADGNVRGQYSYVDPNGKTITVRYTAGKNGFQVEGDHLPQPQSGAPAAGAPLSVIDQSYNTGAHQFPAQPAPQPTAAPQFQFAPTALQRGLFSPSSNPFAQAATRAQISEFSQAQAEAQQFPATPSPTEFRPPIQLATPAPPQINQTPAPQQVDLSRFQLQQPNPGFQLQFAPQANNPAATQFRFPQAAVSPQQLQYLSQQNSSPTPSPELQSSSQSFQRFNPASVSPEQLQSFQGLTPRAGQLSPQQLQAFQGVNPSAGPQLQLSPQQLQAFQGANPSAGPQLQLSPQQLRAFQGANPSAGPQIQFSPQQLQAFQGLNPTAVPPQQLQAFQGLNSRAGPQLQLSPQQLQAFQGAARPQLQFSPQLQGAQPQLRFSQQPSSQLQFSPQQLTAAAAPQLQYQQAFPQSEGHRFSQEPGQYQFARRQ